MRHVFTPFVLRVHIACIMCSHGMCQVFTLHASCSHVFTPHASCVHNQKHPTFPTCTPRSHYTCHVLKPDVLRVHTGCHTFTLNAPCILHDVHTGYVTPVSHYVDASRDVTTKRTRREPGSCHNPLQNLSQEATFIKLYSLTHTTQLRGGRST